MRKMRKMRKIVIILIRWMNKENRINIKRKIKTINIKEDQYKNNMWLNRIIL